MRRNLWVFLLILPGVGLIVFFMIIPIIRIILPTFFPEGSFSLELFQKFVSDSFYRTIFWRTIRIALTTCIICAIFSLPVAFYISRMGAAKKGLMMSLATFPLLTNTVVRAFSWITILGRGGILNNLFIRFNMIDEPLKLLYTEGAIIVGSVYLFIPIMITSLIAVMENITDEIQEAAQSLGANRLTTFLRIIIPLSMPGLIVGSVLVFAGAASAYSTPMMLGGNRNMVMSTLIYQQAMLLNNWKTASVVATIMILTSYLVIFILNKVAAKMNKFES